MFGRSSLSLWTIYESPDDHPGKFVTRRWDVLSTGPAPGPATVVDTLDEAREAVPPGLHWMGRAPGDDEKIVETWL